MTYYDDQLKKAVGVLQRMYDGTVYRMDEWREK